MMALEHLTLGAARESAPCTAEMPRSRGLSALASWKSPRDGDVGQATNRKPEPARGEPALAYSSTLEFSRFPRFIRKIEDAGPEMILNHLKAGPEDTAREMDEGSKLERQLWVLTAMSTFQLQHLGRSPTHPGPPPPGTPGKGKSLELYGNLGESSDCNLYVSKTVSRGLSALCNAPNAQDPLRVDHGRSSPRHCPPTSRT